MQQVEHQRTHLHVKQYLQPTIGKLVETEQVNIQASHQILSLQQCLPKILYRRQHLDKHPQVNQTYELMLMYTSYRS